MITVSEATEKIVKRSRYLSEAMSKDLINISSLARYIKPELEEMLIKDVSVSAVIMALKRLRRKLDTPTSFQNLFITPPEMVVHSNNDSSSVTIRLTPKHKDTPGVYYFFLKSLAWERINILSVHSEDNTFTIVVNDKDINRTFAVLKSLFQKN